MTTVIQGDNFACECKRTHGNPSLDVTWYKDNTQIGVTEKEKAILSFPNVKKNYSGTYRCEAKSHRRAKNETSIELIVNCKYNRIWIDQAYNFKTLFINNLSTCMLINFYYEIIPSSEIYSTSCRLHTVYHEMLSLKVIGRL